MELLKRKADEKVNWVRSIPFILVHLAPLGALFFGITWFSVFLCIGLYAARMFFITAGYHRYFAHRSYKMNRVMQFLMALGGTLAAQKGPLWWASHHRNHHLYSDTENDIHSPLKGFWWSHLGWILCDKFKGAPMERITDFSKYPELRLLDRYYLVPPTILGAVIFFLWGPSALFIGFFLSTVLLWHVTFSVNSLAHVIGSRRFVTDDTSRNWWLLALFTGGEGWHNNHHHYQSSTKQGFYWWEIDVSYYLLKLLSFVGLTKELRKPPKIVLQQNKIKDGHFDVGMFQSHWLRANEIIVGARKNTEEYLVMQKKAMAEAMIDAKQKANDLARVSKGAVRVK